MEPGLLEADAHTEAGEARAHHEAPAAVVARTYLELADLAVYLLSKQADYVNGECVVIDGGLWLRGAGEFNDFLNLPDAEWEAMESARKK